jgi:hypothetical protein
MQEQSSVDLRVRWISTWQRIKPALARVPAKAWVVLGLFLAAAVMMAVRTAISSRDAILHLRVQHGFRSAQISVWVDGDSAYSSRLSGSMKKRFGLIPDSVQGTFSQSIPLSSGQHTIRVRVEPEGGSPMEDNIAGAFEKHSERDLSVNARKSGISLAWQGGTSTGDTDSPEAGWFSRYAGSLFLTIAGSIISALTGYAIRELPGYIRSRQNVEPRT